MKCMIFASEMIVTVRYKKVQNQYYIAVFDN